MDFSWKIGPQGSKMDALGEHIWVQERFWHEGPTSCGPKESFLMVLGSFFDDFFDAFLVTF